MTDLYRVQTTGGETVVVCKAPDGWFSDMLGDSGDYRPNGASAHRVGCGINLATLTPLHMMTDEDLRARDAEVLERVAAHCERTAWPAGLPRHPYECGVEASSKHDALKTAADAIRAMKGTKRRQNHSRHERNQTMTLPAEQIQALDAKLASQIGDDVSVIYDHESLFKQARVALQTALAAMAERDAALARGKALEDALIWASGSPDFADGGQAREGWIKVCALLFPKMTPPDPEMEAAIFNNLDKLYETSPLSPRSGEELVFAQEGAKVDAEIIATLQARVKTLEDGLALIDALDPEGMIAGCSADAARGLVSRMGEIARALSKGSPEKKPTDYEIKVAQKEKDFPNGF